jgi:hypothetical protein
MAVCQKSDTQKKKIDRVITNISFPRVRQGDAFVNSMYRTVHVHLRDQATDRCLAML